MKKQTSIEWLQEQLNPDMKTMQGNIIQDLLEQAKAMERQQIIDAHGIQTKRVNNHKCVTGAQYYQETYEEKTT
jgi:hypothetical protein